MTKAQADAEAAGDGFMAAWRAVSLALWEYRRGNFTEAVAWGQRCLNYREYNNAPRTATARAILAMSYEQMGREDEARAEVVLARDIVEAKFQKRLDRGTPIQGFWFDWVFARILLRESIALIETPSRKAIRAEAIAGTRSPGITMPHKFSGSAALISTISPDGGVRRMRRRRHVPQIAQPLLRGAPLREPLVKTHHRMPGVHALSVATPARGLIDP